MYKLKLLTTNTKWNMSALFMTEEKTLARITPIAGNGSMLVKEEIIELIVILMPDKQIQMPDEGLGKVFAKTYSN